MQATINWHNGAPALSINGKSYPPISYRSFYPEGYTVKNFYTEGYALYQLFPSGILCSLKIPYSKCGEVWDGENTYNWDNLRNHIEMFLSNAPEAKFALLVQLDTRNWYLQEHPEAFDSFKNLVLMCRDAGWRKSATKFLQDIIDFVETEYPDRVYAVHLFAGHTCEWYSHYPEEGLPQSQQLQKSYEDYFGTKDTVPTHEELTATCEGIFRHPAKNKKALEFWDFYNDVIADTICYFAKQTKLHTNGRLLTACFYGYTMCFSHAYLRGHNAYHKVLSCPDLDIIFSPAAYRPFRGMDSSSGFNIAVDSIRFHNKLYLHEIDNTTSLTTNIPFANMVQGLHQRPDDLADTITYARRESARVLEHGGGFWWFDMWNGWFEDPILMQEMGKLKRASEAVYKAGAESVAEVAVFIDTDSARFLTDAQNYDTVYITQGRRTGLAAQYDMVYAQQEELNKLGAPVTYYDSKDLLDPKFPHESSKLYIFPNLYAPSDELKAAISRLREQGKSCLFLYAPGYIGKEDYTLQGMQELTGFAFASAGEETEGMLTSVQNKSLCWSGGHDILPLFTVSGEETVLARYRQTGLPAGCLKARNGGVDAWFGCGPVPATILRDIAKQAGVFIWHEGDDPVYINKGMLGMFSIDGGKRVIRVPADCKLTSLYDGETEHISQNGEITLEFKPKEFKLFLQKPLNE